MAARKLAVIDAPPAPASALPTRPADRAEVRAAAALVERAEGEVARAEAGVVAAEAALAAYREHAADRLLEALEAGTEAVDPAEAAHLAVLDQAQRRLATAEQAHELARVRHGKALDQARCDFAGEVRLLLLAAIERVAELLGPAVAANAEVAALVAHAEGVAGAIGHVHELRLPIPSQEHLGELLAARRRMFAGPPAPPAGLVPVRLKVRHGSVQPGEVCGLPADEARLLCLGLYAVCIDAEDAKRLGVENPMRFTAPTRLRLLRDLQRDAGIFAISGTEHTFDPVEASRLVNLGWAELAK